MNGFRFDGEHVPEIVRNVPVELQSNEDILWIVDQHADACLIINLIDQLLTGKDFDFTMEIAIEQLHLFVKSKGKTLGYTKPLPFEEYRSLVDIRKALDDRRLLIERKLTQRVKSLS